MKAKYFRSQTEWHEWLEQHHPRAGELFVGFYKVDSGKPSITYGEALDEALCFGWIDGVRRSIDSLSYGIRFTPRKKGSRWSAVNAKRVQMLIKKGRMRPQGVDVFKTYDPKKTTQHALERQNAKLPAAYEKIIKSCKAAWEYFLSKPPSYQKLAIWWVMSAKKEETRLKRLAILTADSAQGRIIAPLAWSMRKK
jgi:uncharacterized protein YdeI (YjbR/CyaY-like superfamily)